MNKKLIFIILVISLLFVSCNSNDEKFVVLVSPKITYGVYFNTNYILYVPFTSEQLLEYNLSFSQQTNDTSLLVCDLLGEKCENIGTFSTFDNNGYPSNLDAKSQEIKDMVKTNKQYMVNTSNLINYEGFDRNLVKQILKDIVIQYKQRIEKYEL